MVRVGKRGNHVRQLRTGMFHARLSGKPRKCKTCTAEESQASIDRQSCRQSCRQFVGIDPIYLFERPAPLPTEVREPTVLMKSENRQKWQEIAGTGRHPRTSSDIAFCRQNIERRMITLRQWPRARAADPKPGTLSGATSFTPP